MMRIQISNLDFLVCVLVHVFILVSWNVLGLRIISTYHDCFCEILLQVCVCSQWVYIGVCVGKKKKNQVCLIEIFANTDELEVQIK